MAFDAQSRGLGDFSSRSERFIRDVARSTPSADLANRMAGRFATVSTDQAPPDIIEAIMRRIIIQMEPKLLSELDKAAKVSRMSRAAFVRAAVESVMAEFRRRTELRQIVDSYRASPPEDLSVSRETLESVWPK